MQVFGVLSSKKWGCDMFCCYAKSKRIKELLPPLKLISYTQAMSADSCTLKVKYVRKDGFPVYGLPKF